jgi:predicted transcriptional regulator
MLMIHSAVEERLWSCVARGSYDECWPWTKTPDQYGYGQVKVWAGELDVPADFETPGGVRYRQLMAPRLAFYFVHGRWPQPLALHGCDNPPCCNAENPEHVHEGTHSLNTLEMFARNRQGSRLRSGEGHFNAVLSAAQVEDIRVRYAAGGVTQKALATEFGVEQQSVSRYVRGLRFASEACPPQPGAHGTRAVITPDIRAAVRAAYADGLSQDQVALWYGIGQTSVSRIIREAG